MNYHDDATGRGKARKNARADIDEALQTEGAARGLPGVTRPLRELELEAIASLACARTSQEAEKAMHATGCWLPAMLTDDDARGYYEIFKDPKRGPAHLQKHGMDGRKLDELARDDIEPTFRRMAAEYSRRWEGKDRTFDTYPPPGPDSADPDCLFQNRWMSRGTCAAIISTAGVGKSTFTVQAAMRWAAGEECLGVKPTKPLRVGIFQSEDDEYDCSRFIWGIRKGLREVDGWGEADIIKAQGKATNCNWDGSTGPKFIEYLRLKQMEHHYDLIIINPFFAFYGGDMNDGASMTAFLRHGIDPLIKAKDTKCGCIIVHHTGKPSKERFSQGDVFAAYLGSGSSEFTNYIRSALVITPHEGGKAHGVFDLIGAKHGDRLDWRDESGERTTKKVICYANKLPEYSELKGLTYWCEPDAEQVAEMGLAARTGVKAPKPQNPPRDETPIAVQAIGKFNSPVTLEEAKKAVADAVNADRRKCGGGIKDMTTKEARSLIGELEAGGKVKVAGKGKGQGGRSCLVGLPGVVDAFLNPPLIDVPADKPGAIVPNGPEADVAPSGGRSRKYATSTRNRRGA